MAYFTSAKILEILGQIGPASLRRHFRETILPEMELANSYVARFEGMKAFGIIRIEADIVEAETITIGSEIYEFEVVNTDSSDTTADGDWNNTDDPLSVDIDSGYANLTGTLAVGDLIRVENEIMRVSAIVGTLVSFQRGVSGTTAATHADAQAIYIGDGITAGTAVGVVATLTPAVATDALIDDFNSETALAITAIDIDDNEILLLADSVGVLTSALAEDMTGASNEVDTAAMRGGVAEGNKNIAWAARVPDATEVGTGNMHFASDFTPSVVFVKVVVTATGAAKAWDGDAIIEAGPPARVVVNNDAAVDWADTDTVHVLMLE